ncbi:CRISPR-associated helicase Cas3' [Roseateles sp.]|uniref:CRISPR-associated helicase Cas3' n=1 Tax=Roseateles sp. TaxID=1971397 RepID=UPI00286BFE38|nr:CRISPR-associated helicase Cas3' [Roseateles sp.]
MSKAEPSDAALHAHSQNELGDWHGLAEHLHKVGRLAGEFAEPFNSSLWAELAGRWHDLGKARPGFQRYVRFDANAHIEGRVAGADKTHSAAGALHARAMFIQQLGPQQGEWLARVLEYLIAGHHSGLADWNAGELGPGLAPRLNSADALAEYKEAMQVALAAMPALCAAPSAGELRSAGLNASSLRDRGQPLARSIWLRMLFSALVDADFLDTEAHFKRKAGGDRAGFPSLQQYLSLLNAKLASMAEQVVQDGRADSAVMRARAAVLAQCRAKAALPPGVFSLTVPTGGGKTLSSLAFALEHACQHGLRRVVYAIPYTSIIEQTATVFGAIFGPENLVEHHSQADADPAQESARSRLACENWDAPLVVTTNVQLLESLFADRTSRCRKLHRLAGSVIILDEAQMLPPEFLQPVLDALNVLLTHYGITLLLCTATQPALTDLAAFDPKKKLRGLPVPTPIIDDEAALFAQLQRTVVHWPANFSTQTDWPELLPQLLTHPSALVIVNTRRDAAELTRALPPGTLHLSAAMCGAHRQAAIEEIRQRLKAQRDGVETEPFYVVSTQLIEAGVDVDFPVVFRALAGLDSIAQAAGRCNREGRQTQGDVHVFVRTIPKLLSQLRSAAETTHSLHDQGLNDALAPAAFERYFKLFYPRQPSFDARDVLTELADQEGRLQFNFRSAAKKFRLIDDEDQASLLVPYHLIDAEHGQLEPLIEKLRRGETDRWLMRATQRYTVTVRKRELEKLERQGDVRPLLPGLYLLIDETIYHPLFGLLPRDSPLDAASLVQ